MYLLTYIRELVKAEIERDESVAYPITDTDGNRKIGFCNTGYLLNQTLRQYDIKNSHCHISKKAYAKLKRYGLANVDLNEYLHNSNKIIKKKDKKSKKFNEEFIVDHVIPINMIIKDLVCLQETEDLSNEAIFHELNNIHLCILTKQENEKLNKRFKQFREGDHNFILKNKKGAYKQCGIEIWEGE